MLVLFATVSVALSGTARADELVSDAAPYRYVALEAPADLSFYDPVAVTNDRKVYGNGYRCDENDENCLMSILVHERGGGEARELYSGARVSAVNCWQLLGGSVLSRGSEASQQAALFRHGEVELIPRLPGEVVSSVSQLNDFGVALVASGDGTKSTYYLYRNGRELTLNLGQNSPVRDMNNSGMVTGLAGGAFRMVPWASEPTRLAPLPPHPYAWGMQINERGDVLGYSWGGGSEVIGIWRGTEFVIVLEPAKLEPAVVSNDLLWNRQGLIVITSAVAATGEHSYIVPRPGVRFDLHELVDALPSSSLITNLNDRGDMVGTSRTDDFTPFLLERVEGVEL